MYSENVWEAQPLHTVCGRSFEHSLLLLVSSRAHYKQPHTLTANVSHIQPPYHNIQPPTATTTTVQPALLLCCVANPLAGIRADRICGSVVAVVPPLVCLRSDLNPLRPVHQPARCRLHN